jgi:hypothetical protein
MAATDSATAPVINFSMASLLLLGASDIEPQPVSRLLALKLF